MKRIQETIIENDEMFRHVGHLIMSVNQEGSELLKEEYRKSKLTKAKAHLYEADTNLARLKFIEEYAELNVAISSFVNKILLPATIQYGRDTEESTYVLEDVVSTIDFNRASVKEILSNFIEEIADVTITEITKHRSYQEGNMLEVDILSPCLEVKFGGNSYTLNVPVIIDIMRKAYKDSDGVTDMTSNDKSEFFLKNFISVVKSSEDIVDVVLGSMKLKNDFYTINVDKLEAKKREDK